MSVLQGGKGARQRRADERYYAAVGRQLLLHDRGLYRQVVKLEDTFIFAHCAPAPVEQFLRAEHREVGLANVPIDFRSWARGR